MYNRILASWVVCSVIVLCGCTENRDSVRQDVFDGEDLPILRQVQGTHCHESRAMQLVIRDAATLAQIPLIDVPVDFSEEMLLIVTLGRMPSDQCSVQIERVWREGHQLRVAVKVLAPPANAATTMASPFCIAVVPKSDLNVAHFDTAPPVRNRSWQQSEPPTSW